jgi:hypothetical protein
MTAISRFREHHPDMAIDVGMFNQDSTAMQELPAKTIPAGSHITINTDRGDVNIHAGDGNDLSVSANKTAHGASENAARERVNSVEVTIDKTSDGYMIHPSNQDDSHGNVRVDLEIMVPRSSILTVNTARGDINVAGVGGSVTAVSQQGNVEVHDCGSDVSASIAKGDARITNTAGNVRVTGRGSEIEVTDVMGDANVSGEFYGPIRVRNVAKNTHYISQKSDIQLTKLTGLLELDSGSIEVSDVAGAAKLATNEKDIDIENVGGKLSIANHNAGVKVGYEQPPREDISIANTSGAVELTLPSKSTFEINAISTSGEVDSEFDNPTLNSSNDNGNGKILGRVGTTGPKISIVTTYGSITVRKSS